MQESECRKYFTKQFLATTKYHSDSHKMYFLWPAGVRFIYNQQSYVKKKVSGITSPCLLKNQKASG